MAEYDFVNGDSDVAVGSIRLRILKGEGQAEGVDPQRRCSGLDPTEDTESHHVQDTEVGQQRVAVGSIRLRILKGPPAGGVALGEP